MSTAGGPGSEEVATSGFQGFQVLLTSPRVGLPGFPRPAAWMRATSDADLPLHRRAERRPARGQPHPFAQEAPARGRGRRLRRAQDGRGRRPGDLPAGRAGGHVVRPGAPQPGQVLQAPRRRRAGIRRQPTRRGRPDRLPPGSTGTWPGGRRSTGSRSSTSSLPRSGLGEAGGSRRSSGRSTTSCAPCRSSPPGTTTEASRARSTSAIPTSTSWPNASSTTASLPSSRPGRDPWSPSCRARGRRS